MQTLSHGRQYFTRWQTDNFLLLSNDEGIHKSWSLWWPNETRTSLKGEDQHSKASAALSFRWDRRPEHETMRVKGWRSTDGKSHHSGLCAFGFDLNSKMWRFAWSANTRTAWKSKWSSQRVRRLLALVGIQTRMTLYPLRPKRSTGDRQALGNCSCVTLV